MNTYCLFYNGEDIGTFHSRVPYVSAKKICRLILQLIDFNTVENFKIKNKETGQIYAYCGKRIKHEKDITFKNGKTIHVKFRYSIRRIK